MTGDQRPAPGDRPDCGLPDDGGLAGSVLGAALVEFAQAARRLVTAAQESAWVVPDAASREAVRSVVGSLATGEAAFLALLRDLDSRPDAVPGARAGFVGQTFLTVALRRGRAQAARDVRAARASDPATGMPGQDLHADGQAHAPALGAALAAGLVRREHVDAGVQALAQLPKGLRRRVDPDGVTVGAKADAYLAEQAQTLGVDDFRHVCAQLREFLDPGHHRFDADAYERRFLALRVTDDGMVLIRGMIPAAAGATVRAALDAASAPLPAAEVVDEHGRPALVRDERTKGQRYADALTGIAEHVNGCRDDARGDTHVMVVADLDQLAAARAARTTHEGRSTGDGSSNADGYGDGDCHGQGASSSTSPGRGSPGAGRAQCLQTGPINALTLQALACDAILQAVVLDRSGAVLRLGRTVRTVSAAQRRALIARDRGCVIPGCPAPPNACDAHHVRWWRHGGVTDLENLALVCRRHHADLHAGVWTLEMVGGVPYGIPPSWADPARRRLRNTVHDTAGLVRRFATQLVIDLAGQGGTPAEPADTS